MNLRPLGVEFRENKRMDSNRPIAAPQALAPEDFYFEGPNLVFTAAYHLKRGSCCGSGCRHCPYRGTEAEVPGTAPEAPGDGDCETGA
jgi:hypothetical protein